MTMGRVSSRAAFSWRMSAWFQSLWVDGDAALEIEGEHRRLAQGLHGIKYSLGHGELALFVSG